MCTKKYFIYPLALFMSMSYLGFAQSQNVEIPSEQDWSSLIKLAKFDPNDDQQSVADTDFVGNADQSIMETQKITTTFSDGVTDEVYYFRVRMGQSNPNTSFYFGVDVSGDLIADLFIEANAKAKPNYVSFHQRDYSKTGLSPSQTSWLNGLQNQELILSSRNSEIRDYSAGTDIDGGNSGTDYWIEFAFTEEIIKSYVLDVFGLTINGDSVIALYGFTSTSQTSNGDVMGVDDKIPGELDKTWQELGVIINGTLNNIASGEIVVPTVTQLVTEDTTPTITGSWGGEMLGDDSLSVEINGVIYTTDNGLIIDGLNWSLTLDVELNYGTWNVEATTTRQSSSVSVIDTTEIELWIVPPAPEDETTPVTSGNDGGLESNGNLANLIAKRNFKRVKNKILTNQKKNQSKFKDKNKTVKTSANTIDLQSFFPTTGITGDEMAYISSATDLLGITNAEQIFSVDYYRNDLRVAAALATQTAGKIYDHSKIVCDRLNNSSLEDAWVFNLVGHEIIIFKIIRANGLQEYALSFSVAISDDQYKLHSYWNIDQYPEDNYLNFQVWGSSIQQIVGISSKVLNNIESDKPVVSVDQSNRIPLIFVQQGSYKNGKIHLKIKNKSKDTSVYFEGNKRSTELSSSEFFNEYINLYGNLTEEVIVDTGSLFDIGFYIKGDNSNQQDALYLADGPWGIDYDSDQVVIENFNIESQVIGLNGGNYEIERDVKVAGNVKGTMNVFRNLLPGDLVFDATPYKNIEFEVVNNFPIEVILVTEGLTDWNNRLRYIIPENQINTIYNLSFDDFLNANGLPENFTKLRSVVFSIQGNYSAFKPFKVEIKSTSFKGATTLGLLDSEISPTNTVINYPNPFQSSTTIVLSGLTGFINITVFDMLGRIVDKQRIVTNQNGKNAAYHSSKISRGLFKYIFSDDSNNIYTGTFFKN